MSTDRELLEWAAKAIDKHITGWDHQVAILDDGTFWQPLYETMKTDCMGDALRLAVKLKIDFYIGDDDGPATYAGYFASGRDRQRFAVERHENHDNDYAATRRAIVRAAAEIGKHSAPSDSGREG